MFLLYHRNSFRTGKVLGRALGIPCGRELRGQPNVVIRWGNATPITTGYEFVNRSEAISNASDKLRALRFIQEAGIRVPEFSATQPDLQTGTWLGRDRHGFGGRDIVVYSGDGFLLEDRHEWFSKYIENDREYRLHVAFGEIIRTQRKYLDHPEQRTSDHVKNYRNGYRFRAPRTELNNSRKAAAIGAVAACGLDFGAVDLIVAPDQREYVLEINTAPKCSPLTARAYINAFVNHFGAESFTLNLRSLEGLNNNE